MKTITKSSSSIEVLKVRSDCRCFSYSAYWLQSRGCPHCLLLGWCDVVGSVIRRMGLCSPWDMGSRERVRPGSLSTTSRTEVPVHCIVFTVIVPGVVLYSSSPSMHGPDSIHYSFYCVCASSIGGRRSGGAIQ